MSTGHAHHHHDHHHAPAGGGGDRRWLIGIGLNLAFVAVEVVAGLHGRSTALLADAGHNLSDVLTLVLAGASTWLASRPPSARRTYGFGKATVWAALINAGLLVFACGALAREAIGRFGAPSVPLPGLMMAVAGAGVVVNGLTAFMFSKGRGEDVNVRSAFQHMAGDTAISAGVMVAGALIAFTGQTWIDPAASLAILAIILLSSWGLLKEAFDLAMDTAPARLDVGAVRALLESSPEVTEVHDLHVWPLSASETALTAHLVRPCGSEDGFVKATAQALHDRFGIRHATLQIECERLVECEDLHD